MACAIICVAAVFSGACVWKVAPERPLVWTPMDGTDAAATAVEARRALVRGLYASARAKLVTPERDTVFSEELAIRAPCAFRITVLGLFDRPQAYLASNCEEIAMHDVGSRRFFTGTIEQGMMLDQFPVPLKAEEIVASLLGIPYGFAEAAAGGEATGPIEDPQKRGWRVEHRGAGAAETDIYWFDSETHHPVRWARSGPRGEFVAVEWDQWGPASGSWAIELPRIVRIALIQRGLMLELAFRDVEMNPGDLDESLFTLKPPRGITPEPLGQPGLAQ